MKSSIKDMPFRFRFAGQEDVFHQVKASSVLPEVLAERNYERAFIVSSRTLNQKTSVVRELESSLGNTWVGTTDKVGEHAPINNIIEASKLIQEANADIIIGIGGGSVIDFTRFVQLCLTENINSREELIAIEATISGSFQIKHSSTKIPVIRTLNIPTTLSTAEWTMGGTPVNEETKLKIFLTMKMGGPEVILYDPEIMSKTPMSLLLATGIRGLDHAINTRCGLYPHPMADPMTDKSIQLYIENLPKIYADSNDLEAIHQCQVAASLSGVSTMSVVHGFSHWMVHIIGPYADVGHSEAACICMVAQAKWLEGYVDERYNAIKKLLGKEDEAFHEILSNLLQQLNMPTRFSDIGITSDQLDVMAGLAMNHPLLSTYNVRAIDTEEKVRQVLALGE